MTEIIAPAYVPISRNRSFRSHSDIETEARGNINAFPPLSIDYVDARFERVDAKFSEIAPSKKRLRIGILKR